jgi:hypothetical protein
MIRYTIEGSTTLASAMSLSSSHAMQPSQEVLAPFQKSWKKATEFDWPEWWFSETASERLRGRRVVLSCRECCLLSFNHVLHLMNVGI